MSFIKKQSTGNRRARRVLSRLISLAVTLTLVSFCLVPFVPVIAEQNGDEPDTASAQGTLTYTVSDDGLSVTVSYEVNGELRSYTVPNRSYYLNGGFAGTDDLGRSLYNAGNAPVIGQNGRHEVGLLYYLWHGEHGDNGIFNLQEILETNGVEAAGSASSCAAYGNVGDVHWFAEPLYGYYYSNDEWVIRKHIELLTNACVDFLLFDVTNGYYYPANALAVMKICHEFNEQGFDAPQVVFYTDTGSAGVAAALYKEIYSANLYPDTWYMLDGKPVIVADKTTDTEKHFTVKQPLMPNDPIESEADCWPWSDISWPQTIFLDSAGNKNAVSVSVAQNNGNFVFSTSSLYDYRQNRGRSFSMDHATDMTSALSKSYLLAKYEPAYSYKGLNFQAQWDYAIESDVPYILVTGWNEWVAIRQNGKSVLGSADALCFVGTASVEFSRDTEMARGYYFDNYYLQLVSNIQRAKGVAPIIVQDSLNTMDINGSFDAWDRVTTVYTDCSGDTAARNGKGFGNTTYSNTTGNNDIVAAKIAYDRDNLYVYAETAAPVTDYREGTSWMQMYLNIDGKDTGWYGYDYIVNYSPKNSGTTTVASYSGSQNAFAFNDCADIQYRVDGNRIMFVIPFSAINVTDFRKLDFQFKLVDSLSAVTTMEQCYTDGDCAPLGRLDFVFQNYIPDVSVLPDIETPTDAQDTLPEGTEPVSESGQSGTSPAAADTEPDTVPEDIDSQAQDASEVPGTVAEPVETDTQDAATLPDNHTDGGCKSALTLLPLVFTACVISGAAVTLFNKRDTD